MGLTITQMQLAPVAQEAAERLLVRFPEVQFTSGRRTMRDQARVMATNIRANPRWIIETYQAGAPLQSWLDRHFTSLSWEEIEQGLFEQLMAMPNAHQLSRHLKGLAFDLLPMVDRDGLPTAQGREVMDYIRLDMRPRKFLTREGGLVRWHVDFDEPITTQV